MTAGEDVRRRMERELGRVGTPAIIIGKRVFWGFEQNRTDIAELLGLPAEGPFTADRDGATDSAGQEPTR